MRTSVRLAGGVEIHAEADDDLAAELSGFANYVRTAPEMSSVNDGYRIMFGWSPLTFCSDGFDAYQVHEPDYAHNVLSLRPTISATLRVISSQLEVAARLQANPLEAVYDEKVVYAEDAMSSDSFYLERATPVPADSGWYMGRLDADDQGQLCACRVFDLLRLKPYVVPYLSLPPGFLVVFRNGVMTAVANSDGTDILV